MADAPPSSSSSVDARESNKNASGAKGGAKSLWEKIEPAAKVLSSIAIPIVIAIGGWWIQSSVTQQSINKDYVSLAISILQRPKGDVEQDLRTWAVELLASYAPVRFSPETVERLKKGSLNLSSIITTLAN